MTLAISLVTPQGIWASVDHRLTVFPTGQLLTDSSVKHVVLRCPDGAALISYTGLGRVGRIDLSQWIREVLRGETRTLDASLVDLKEQATLRIGLPAYELAVPHVFLAGAFLGGSAWAVEIRNLRTATPLLPEALQPQFETVAVRVEKSVLLLGGGGRNAVSAQDRALLMRVSSRRPRRPEEYMRLLGDVNRRAAESQHPHARTMSTSCTVVYLPPSGDNVQQQWFGAESDSHLAPVGPSHLLFGIDLGEMGKPFMERSKAFFEGHISEEEFKQSTFGHGPSSVEPRGRR